MSGTRLDINTALRKPSLRRVAQMGGVKRLSRESYKEMRKVLAVYLVEVIRKVVLLTQWNKKKTVLPRFAMAAVENDGLGGGYSKICKKWNPRKKKKGVKRKTTARSGTQSLRQIRFYQKQMDCNAFQKAPFDAWIRGMAAGFHADIIRFSEGGLDIIREAAQNFLISLMAAAQTQALHAGRVTVMPKDIVSANNLIRM